MKPTTAKILPPGEPNTLFDRYREAGLADRLVTEMEQRLKKRKVRRRSALRKGAAAVALIAGALWAVPYYRDTSSVSVAIASQSTITLADGSRAELNANTDLKTDFRYGRRVIQLQHGEGFFSVAHDAAHPFLVETPAGTVRVTGTKFNVRLEKDGHAEVTLVEGHVRVEPVALTSTDSVPLDPGQQAVLGYAQPRVLALTPAEMARTLAWREGKIVLDGVLLGDAVARFADYHGCTIQVDSTAAKLRLGGSYSLKNLPQFLEALKSTDAVAVLKDSDNSYRIVGR